MSIAIEFNAKTDAFQSAVDKLIGGAKQLGDAFQKAAPGSAVLDKLTATGKATDDVKSKLEEVGRVKVAPKVESEHVNIFHAAVQKATGALHGMGSAAGQAAAPIGQFGEKLKGAAIAFVGIYGAFDLLKKATDIAGGIQVADRQLHFLTNSAEDNAKAIEHVHEISQKTFREVPEVKQYFQALYEGGFSVNDAADKLQRLSIVAKGSGNDLGELVEIFTRVNERMEVTSRDALKLAQAGLIPQSLAQEYKNLEISIERQKPAIEAANLAWDRWFEDTQKHVGQLDTIGEKMGLVSKAFDAWEHGRKLATGYGTSIAAVTAMGNTFQWQFSEGMKEIAKTSGLSMADVAAGIKSGVFSYQDLMSAQKEAADEAHKLEDRRREDESKAEDKALLDEKLSIIYKVNDALKTVTDAGGKFTKSLSDKGVDWGTWFGALHKIQYDITEILGSLGSPVIAGLTPIFSNIHNIVKGWSGDIQEFFSQFQTEGPNAWSSFSAKAAEVFDDIEEKIAKTMSSEHFSQGLGGLWDAFTALSAYVGDSLLNALSVPLARAQVAIEDATKRIAALSNPTQWWSLSTGQLDANLAAGDIGREKQLTSQFQSGLSGKAPGVDPADVRKQELQNFMDALHGGVGQFVQAGQQGFAKSDSEKGTDAWLESVASQREAVKKQAEAADAQKAETTKAKAAAAAAADEGPPIIPGHSVDIADEQLTPAEKAAKANGQTFTTYIPQSGGTPAPSGLGPGGNDATLYPTGGSGGASQLFSGAAQSAETKARENASQGAAVGSGQRAPRGSGAIDPVGAMPWQAPPPMTDHTVAGGAAVYLSEPVKAGGAPVYSPPEPGTDGKVVRAGQGPATEMIKALVEIVKNTGLLNDLMREVFA